MKSTLLSVLSLLALFTACSTDLEIQKTAQEGKDINEVIVTVENRNSYDVDLAQTRTVYTNIGGKNQFVWDASDMIGIFPDEGNQVGFSMKDGAGQTSAKFTGGGWGLKTSSKYAAYYPLIHDFDLDRTQIPLDFTGQVQTGNGTTAHLGAYDYMAAPAAEPLGNTVNFAFKGLSTLIHLKITMPKAGTYKKVYLETDGKFITKGKLNLEEDSFTATETSNVVELNLNDLTIESEGGLLDTYMMIAPVDLSENTLTAIVVDESGTEYKSVLAGKDFKGGAIWNYSRDGIRNEGGGSSSGIYLGVMGFNQQVYSSSISKLDKENKSGFESFIDDLNMKYGTLLYYSVDQAINTMQSATFPSDLSTVAIVTFTDGLDQGSMMMEDSYDNDNDYLNAINQRIKNEKINGLSLTAYSIGLRGQDVSDVTQFKSNLSKLASSAENATEVTSMSEVNAKFKEIAEQLTQSSYVQTVNLKMPGVSNGVLVRFTFDNVSSAKNSSLYIEGTFNLSTLSLENVKYVGLSSTSGTTIKGVRDGIFVNFTFDGVHTNNNTLIDKNFTDEWTYITSNSSWQINSEFDKSEDSDVVVKRSSAAIMLVLDCSSSLASDFGKAKSNAKDFINTLYEAVGGENDSEPNTGSTDNSIYSTTPKDLSLAIWKNGTRYYLTKEEYAKANLTGAVVEGLTIIGGGESFILSLNDVQIDPISNTTIAKNLYEDIMPTAKQGQIISAKWSDIMSALSWFGGAALSSSSYYYTLSTQRNTNYNYSYCIYGSGGSLDSGHNYSPYVRGVRPTNYSSAIYWNDPNDLKLSVIINGTREFLKQQEYANRKYEIEKVEGVAVIAGGEKFVVHLTNAQTSSISNTSTAMTLYKEIIPTAKQGEIISARWNDINSAIRSFGGAALSSSSPYYTLSTQQYTSGGYSYCICGSGGSLYSNYSYSPYVRGVTNIK